MGSKSPFNLRKYKWAARSEALRSFLILACNLMQSKLKVITVTSMRDSSETAKEAIRKEFG